MTDLAFLDLTDAVAMLESGQVTSRELTEAQLARIGRSGLNAFISVLSERALAQADAIDAGQRQAGPLRGVPIAVKDIFDIAGLPTTAAMPFRRGYRAEVTATSVKRLEAAGAVILGKLNLAEGVYAAHGDVFGAPVNPWDAQRYPGASSSGSGVAVAAGQCYAALSSDTGGSIRLPSSANNVTGLKPTWGRVSRHGVFELAGSMDHVGVIARSAADVGLVLQVVAGADPADLTASSLGVPSFDPRPSATGLSGLRIGLDAEWVRRGVDADITVSLHDAVDTLRSLGATIVPIDFPDPEQIILDWFELCGVEAALAHEETYPARRNEYGSALQSLLDLGLATSGIELHRRQQRRRTFAGQVQNVFADIDLIAVPSMACVLPTLEQIANIDPAMISMLHRFTCSFTMSGNPTITLPCRPATDGSPIAFQLVGPHFNEAQVIAVGHAFQQHTMWHRRRAPGAEL